MKEFNIYAFADEASPIIDEQIKAMKENGLAGLEIRNVDGVNVADISDRKAREVRAKMDAAGLKVWTIGSPIGKINIEKDDFKTHTERFKRTIETAEILGAENIRLFSFFMPEDKNPDDYKNEVISRLGLFSEIAEGTGITLCHENEKGIYGDNAARCLEIFKAVPAVKGIFDPANFVQCGQDTIEAWKLLADDIKYLHIKDSLSDNSVVPCGKGDGNIPYILGEYSSRGGKNLTLEPHLAVFDGLSGLEQKGEESKIGTRFSFSSNEEAFNAGVAALKETIKAL